MAPAKPDVHRAADRPRTIGVGVTSRHCFSFGRHYDADNISFGPLLAVNDETLATGSGFGAHHHHDLEIVTWVVSGALVHEDSTGGRHVTEPGTVQRLSAGAGVDHSETAASATRLIQMWITPDETGATPSYEQRPVDLAAVEADHAVVASGPGARHDGAAVPLGRTGARLLASRLEPADVRRLPGAELVHLFLVRGEVQLETGEWLEAGDSARLRSAPDVTVTARSEAEILVWLFGDVHIS